MFRFKGVFRVIGLAALMLSGAIAFTLHRAEAHLKESLRGFGEQIAALDGFRSNTAPRQLFVNGLELHLVTVSTRLPVKDALDRFQSTCHAVGNIDLPATLQQKLLEPPKKAQSRRDLANAGQAHASEAIPAGVIRQDAKHEGFLACIDIGENTDAEAFLRKLSEFGKTGNLNSLGQMRYALARRSAETTSLLLLWTEGDANLKEMFPHYGDAPGSELRDVPRPEGGRRLLSAFEQGMPFGFVAYGIDGQGKSQDVATANRAYMDRLVDGSWHVKPVKNHGSLAEKAGRRLLVQVSQRKAGQVVVTISDLG